MMDSQALTVAVAVLCGAWAGLLIGAIYHLQIEVQRLRRAASEAVCQHADQRTPYQAHRLWSGHTLTHDPTPPAQGAPSVAAGATGEGAERISENDPPSPPTRE
jgi:hypothetical protein